MRVKIQTRRGGGGRGGRVKVCESLILLTHQAWTNTVVTDGRTDGRTESHQDATDTEKEKKAQRSHIMLVFMFCPRLEQPE